jgi:hypothetical protein
VQFITGDSHVQTWILDVAFDRIVKEMARAKQRKNKMGKAADNEKAKLRATAFNNVGVGLMLGGGLIPLLVAFVQNAPVFTRQWGLAVFGAAAAILAGILFHKAGLRELTNIQD